LGDRSADCDRGASRPRHEEVDYCCIRYPARKALWQPAEGSLEFYELPWVTQPLNARGFHREVHLDFVTANDFPLGTFPGSLTGSRQVVKRYVYVSGGGVAGCNDTLLVTTRARRLLAEPELFFSNLPNTALALVQWDRPSASGWADFSRIHHARLTRTTRPKTALQ
jgi:hypothetical protein